MHDTLSSHFPWWQGYLNVIPLCLTGLLGYLATRLSLGGVTRAAREAGDADWIELARRRSSARTTALAMVFWSMVAAAAFAIALRGPLGSLSLGPLLLCAVVFAAGGAVLGGRASMSGIPPDAPWGDDLRRWAIMLLFVRPPVVAFVGAFLGPWDLSAAAVSAFGVLVLALAFAPIPGGLLRGLGLVTEPPARLVEAVSRASAATGVTVRATVVLRTRGLANALVAPRPFGVIFATEGLLDALNDRELEAVLAHELGHLTESRWVIAARYAAALVWLPLAFVQVVVATHGWIGGVALVAAVIAVWRGFLVLSRRLEHRADAHAAERDREGLASALEALHRFNGIPPVLSAKTTHPSLYDRMIALGVTPTYPRPQPPPDPPTVRMVACLYLVFGTFCGGYYGWAHAQRTSEESARDLDRYVVAASLTGGSVEVLTYLVDEEPHPARRVWYEEALARENGMAWAAHDAAITNAGLGRCIEAQAWLREGRRRSAAENEWRAAEAVAECRVR